MPVEVYSKNGSRPVYAPQSISDIMPLHRDQARTNDRNNFLIIDPNLGVIYKVRVNMIQTIYTLPANVIPNSIL